MELLNCFPTVIAEENLNISSDKILSYINQIKSQNLIHRPYYEFSYTENQNLLEDNIFLDLKNTILDISRKYLKDIEQSFEDVQIATSWGVLCPSQSQSDVHHHANSYISGVFYLTTGSPIHFLNPLQALWFFESDINIPTYSPRGTKHISFTPTPGKLLIFPSWLKHKIIPGDTSERISIAFNIIPKGEFGSLTSKIYLQ